MGGLIDGVGEVVLDFIEEVGGSEEFGEEGEGIDDGLGVGSEGIVGCG